MKSSLVFIIFFLFSIFSFKSQAQVTTVPAVDLTRYVGKWYEVASIPHSFQKQCVRGVTAEYKDLGEGLIEVTNSCETQSGARSVSEGRAKVVDDQSKAKLKVTFVKLGGWIFWLGGDYWVIDLEKDYRYAVVGHPTLKYGWILSRNPEISMSDLQVISQNLKKQGYNLCDFLMTVQEGSVSSRLPLCEYVRP